MTSHALFDTTSHYQILSRLGGGAMGQLFWALKIGARGARCRVVLKTSSQASPRHIDWLAREAELGMAATGGPGIVAHRAFFEAGERGWIELEPVDGVDLSQLHERARRAGQRVPPYVAVVLIVDLLEALAHLARVGVIHRDISPRNVMVATATARVTLVDFGLARRVGVEPDPASARNLVGQLGFMAPEQAWGEPLEPSADLFAASAVLWALLTGRPPFGHGAAPAVLARLMADVREPPSRYAPHIPRALDAAVLAGLARRRADRPASADELRAVLLELMPGLLPAGTGSDPRGAVARWVRSVTPEVEAEETRWVADAE